MTTQPLEGLPEALGDTEQRRVDADHLLDGHRLARNSALSLVGQVLPGIAGIVFLPYLVHKLGAERFGMLSLIWLGIGYFSIFDFGLGRSVTKTVSEDLGHGDLERAGASARIALVLLLWVGLAMGVVCLVSAGPLVERFLKLSVHARPEASLALQMMAAAIPLVVLTTGVRGILEAAQAFNVVNLVRVPTGILSFLAPAVVVWAGYGLPAIVGCLLAIRAVGFAVYLRGAARVVPLKATKGDVAKTEMRRLLRFGSWVAVSNIISPLMVSADRVLIGWAISVTAVTYYATPFEAVSKLMLIPGAISIVLFPAFSTAGARDSSRLHQLYSAGFWFVIYLLLPAVAMGALLAPELLQLWLRGDFAARSAHVTVWLAIGMLANGAAQVPYALLQAMGRSDLTAKTHMAEAPAYALLLLVLMHAFGVAGAAMAWTIRALADLGALLVLGTTVGKTRPAAPRGVFLLAVVCILLALAPLVLFARAGLLVVALASAGWLLITEARKFDLRRLLMRSTA
jgi:O-antigen/teichoic acid export membrane protein